MKDDPNEIAEHLDALPREDKNKTMKLPEGETVLLSEFIEQLNDQDYVIRKKKEIS